MEKINYNDYVRIDRFALAQDEWKEVLHSHLINFSFPMEIELKKPPSFVNHKREWVNFENFRTTMLCTIGNEIQLREVLEIVNIETVKKLDDCPSDTLIIRKENETIGMVDGQCITVWGIIKTEITDIYMRSEFHQFFDNVLSNAAFPIEVTFCGGGVLHPIDQVYKLILEDKDWERLLEKKLFTLLERKELTTGWFAFKKGVEKSSPYLTLENFTTAFHMNNLYNFLLARDANNRFTFIDHEYTNFSIVNFGNIQNNI